MAHAYEKGRVNPDIAGHEQRLAQDLPVAQALAEYLIEYKRGVPSQGSVWDDHHYELEGFRALLGPTLVGQLKQKMDVAATDLPKLPPLGIRARGGDVHPSLEHLTPTWMMAVDGSLCLILANDRWPVRVLLRLNFPAERLDFDAASMVEITEVDTATAEEARHQRSDLMRCLLRNAQLQVCRSDNGQIMGRTNGFLPNDAQYRGMKALLVPETS